MAQVSTKFETYMPGCRLTQIGHQVAVDKTQYGQHSCRLNISLRFLVFMLLILKKSHC